MTRIEAIDGLCLRLSLTNLTLLMLYSDLFYLRGAGFQCEIHDICRGR